MNMEDFHCDMLNVSFDFSKGDFDKSTFLKEADIEDESKYKDKEGDLIFHFYLSSKKDIKQQHSHLTVLFRKDTSGRVGLDFHRPGSKAEKIKKKPPYLEDAAKWLTQFFTKKEFQARLAIAYNFDKAFEPTIPLPFPLVASSRKLSGLKVSGLSLDYPTESDIRLAIIQSQPDGPWLFLQEVTAINLETFGLYKELRKLQSTVTSLIRKRDTNNETNSRKAKT